jgi:hypothetical protein
MSGARPFGSFWEGGYPTFAKRDSPEGAKYKPGAHAEAMQNYTTTSNIIAEKIRMKWVTRAHGNPRAHFFYLFVRIVQKHLSLHVIIKMLPFDSLQNAPLRRLRPIRNPKTN